MNDCCLRCLQRKVDGKTSFARYKREGSADCWDVMYRVRQRIPLLYISLLADVIHHVPTSGEILHFQIEKFAKHELVFVVYAPRYSGGGCDMARSYVRRETGDGIIGDKSTKIFLSKQVFPRFFYLKEKEYRSWGVCFVYKRRIGVYALLYRGSRLLCHFSFII